MSDTDASEVSAARTTAPADAAPLPEAGAPLGTLERGLYLLGLFTAETPERTLRELREESGLAKATVRRLMHTLESMGWVAHDPDHGRYSLGPRLLPCLFAMTSTSMLTNVAHPNLVQLASATTESAMLSTWAHDGALTLDLVTTPRHFKPFTSVGMVMPGLATADAQVLTAFSPETYWDARFDTFADHAAGSTEKDREAQRRLWSQIRQTGIAYDREGWKPGVCAVAAPVLDTTGCALASISVVMPSERAENGNLEQYAQAVRDAATAVSRAHYMSPSTLEPGSASIP
ncbi:IclR family transcriptional regulator [Rhodococcus opacus]|uniref:IclR family transcriptional regulator n=1 Tax=Rhodococcus opacus TaxID=37919 RepID=UPI0002EF5A3B|nr:IclR family transcriptional regulator [Rhodococcus opacus]AHK35922.1 putative HTH-type transcriptional regulator yagI [Rhodococcus opacus PD630]UDH01353.1 IclR family transcriptional regulator [Rhodococcus opacus PD630]